jgi:hypothetical protein
MKIRKAALLEKSFAKLGDTLAATWEQPLRLSDPHQRIPVVDLLARAIELHPLAL